jgi:response regulator RpfG family c-di-GMP phosphodiesterase
MSDQKRLLILDDDEEILDLMSRILGKKYTLLTKTNTENLEKDLQEFKPDAILIDHFIGDKTSSEVLTKSLKSMSHIPIILHSAYEDIEKLYRDTKVAGYIHKPSSISEIRNCIEKVLAGGIC